MLNSKIPGGTLYLGLLDDGKIEGFMMSPDQMDHFRETVDNVCNRMHKQPYANAYATKVAS